MKNARRAREVPAVSDEALHVERETSILDLAPNPNNPREPWKPEQTKDFITSLQRFGDLGGIILNLASGHLVGGHKRVEAFRASTDVRITKVPQAIDTQGTIAHGYVLVDGHRFAYREVQWAPDMEAAANLAANRWTAEWNWEQVSASLQGISDTELLALTGFPAHELENLMAAEWSPAQKGELEASRDRHAVVLTEAQYALLQEVKVQIPRDEDAEGDLTDGQVVEYLCHAFMRTQGKRKARAS